MRARLKPGVLLALPLLLAACAGEAPPPATGAAAPDPIMLDVGYIDVEDRRSPLPEANFIDERRSAELGQEVAVFLGERLRAGGGPGSALAVIERASLTERLRDERRGGVLGIVTGEPTFIYEGEIAVRILLRDGTGLDQASTSAAVSRTRTIGAGASVVERDAEARRLTRDLLDQLGPALEQAVSRNLAPLG
jgi:hypothetical protein